MTYQVSFITSAAGALGGNIAAITVAAPAGTVLPNRAVDVFDLTTFTDLGGTGGPTLTNSGATASWVVNASGVPANHRIQVTITGVTNPAAGTLQLGVSTSSDAVVASTPGYVVSAPRAASSPGVSLTNSAPGASGVTYTVSLTTSATGALAGNSGTITLSAPAGTSLPGGGIDVFDLTTDTDLGGSFGATLSNGGATATWTVNSNGVPAGDEIELTVSGVTNPAAGSYRLAVSTSSDSVPGLTPGYPIS